MAQRKPRASRKTARKTDSYPRNTAAVDHSTASEEERAHTLDFPIPADPIYLDADETRLEQVFGNLLNNASKFSDAGTLIALHIEAQLREDQARNVVVRVRDTGIGIDPEVLPHVFDLFVQGNRSLDRSHGGLGIGLTLAKRIVELHGGTVEAHSEGPGRGSEFVVRLPVLTDRDPEEAHHLKSAPQGSVRLSPRRRILVVDDNEDAVTMMALILTSKGYDVATARDGTAALEIATSFQPELVVLDIGLPEIDGYEVARRLRKLPALAGIFIIALSGYGTEHDRQRARDAGFNHHLTKPVAPAVLLDLLSQTLA